MSGDPERFDASWLALREPVDHRSRDESLARVLHDRWETLGWTRVLDLGSGTGSNLRYLELRLPTPQGWTVLDRDRDLLGLVTPTREGVEVSSRIGDLAKEGLAEASQAHLVTGSALLDLVSEAWLAELVSACTTAGSGAFFTLSYNGEIRWDSASPERQDPVDDLIRDAVNAHQRGEKGLGLALGPEATASAERLFLGAGYETWTAPSPWRLGPDDVELVAALIDGWESAALEQRPNDAKEIRRWSIRKRERIRSTPFTLVVGHLDFLALPFATPET